MNSHKIIFQTETHINEADDQGISTVRHHLGSVVALNEEGTEGSVIGKLHAWTIMPDWKHDHMTEAGDLDGETGEAARAIFQSDGDIREDLQEAGLIGSESGVLFLNTLKIDEAHRGNGLGLKVLWHAIRILGDGCGAVICKPHPLYDEHQPKSDTEVAAGKKKLRAYWSKLGFKKLPKTDFYVLNLNLKQISFERATSIKKRAK